MKAWPDARQGGLTDDLANPRKNCVKNDVPGNVAHGAADNENICIRNDEQPSELDRAGERADETPLRSVCTAPGFKSASAKESRDLGKETVVIRNVFLLSFTQNHGSPPA